ncbi:MAG: hypothetical protein WHS64_08755 [Fervidobacterium sp.]|uniref:Uncharacterized protein n=1 Tax=Fervidobacterium gondwanense DSM 13020 TaxID=1121883 RepID=A0A1M7TGK7_FERGO|nr:hypothetical protein [Fervidobacterium gondwanense]UXF01875.1 hypothetical protein IB67_10300 [Fervidobacterium riparium]SHN69748.1 hypothetical protein SAMN02745226_01965 [Fervidobacterium gondwanense DSM 13020]
MIEIVSKDTWIKINLKDRNSLANSVEPMHKSSGYFSITLRETEKMKGIPYIVLSRTLKEPNENQIADQIAIFKRIISINNYLHTTFLPEIVDFYVKRKEHSVKVRMVKEFFKGKFSTVNFYDYFKRGYMYEGGEPSNTKDEISDVEWYAAKNTKVAYKKFLDRVVKQIFDFQEYLFRRGLIHVGICPFHFSLGVDYAIKFFGERYIVRHKNGVIDDPAIRDERYGSLVIPVHTPAKLRRYLEGEDVEVGAIEVFAYQLGVLIFNTLTSFRYNGKELSEELIMKADFDIGRNAAERFKDLILSLTSEEILKALDVSDFDSLRNVFYDNLHELFEPSLVSNIGNSEWKGDEMMQREYISDDLFENLFETKQNAEKKTLTVRVYINKALVIEKMFGYDEVIIGRANLLNSVDVDLSKHDPDKIVSRKALRIERDVDGYYVVNTSHNTVVYIAGNGNNRVQGLLKTDERVKVNGVIRLVIEGKFGIEIVEMV